MPQVFGGFLPFKEIVAKTADYTVTAADNGTMFTTLGSSGAVNFTLPTAAANLRYRFVNAADQNMTVTATPVDTMVVFNDLAADSVAFSTGGEKIGGAVDVISDGTKWYVFQCSAGSAHTLTVAT